MAQQITRAAAVTKRDEWLAAEAAVSTGQIIEIGGRSLTRVDLPNIRQAITYWSRVVDEFDTVAAAGATTPKNHGFRVADFRNATC